MWCAIGTGFSDQDCDCTIRVSGGKYIYIHEYTNNTHISVHILKKTDDHTHPHTNTHRYIKNLQFCRRSEK